MKQKELSEAAKEARRAYNRQWYSQNKDKVREQKRRHWERVAERMEQEKEEVHHNG